MCTTDELCLDAREVTPSKAFGLLKASVVPRPIAWTATVSIDGANNLAPFSFEPTRTRYSSVFEGIYLRRVVFVGVFFTAITVMLGEETRGRALLDTSAALPAATPISGRVLADDLPR